MDILRIEGNGSKGFMEIYPDKFFPCSVEKAKKLFKLIDQWCSDETIADLDVYLHQEKEKALKQKEKQKKQIILRLAPSLWQDIATWANDDFRSINSQIEYILTKAVKERKNRNRNNL